MALNASLVLSGNSEGAERALRDVNQEMERGEKGAEAYNRAYAATDASIKKLATAQAAAKQEIAQTTAAYKAGEISLEAYNRELLETKTALGLVESEHRQTVTALRQANQALGQTPGQTGMARAGYVQLGQQMQDVATMAMMPGVNLGTIIATQGGQVATAVQMMGGRFSGLAGFIAGPWGAAILVGASLLGNLASELWNTEEAAASAEFATSSFGEAQSILGTVVDLTTGKLKDQTSATLALARAQAAAGVIKAQADQAEARSELRSIAKGSFRNLLSGTGINPLAGYAGTAIAAGGRVKGNDSRLAQQVLSGGLDADQAVKQLRGLQREGKLTEEQFLRAAEAASNLSVGAENQSMFEKVERALDGDPEAISGFLKPQTGSKRQPKASGGSSIDREARELQRLTEWGDRAAESIARISERFGEQPTLVVQVNQATRDLDDTIADLERRKPPGFAEMIEDARTAQSVVQDALLRPFAELRQESERLQQVDLLLLSGKEDQAAVVQEIWRMEERLGPLNAEQRAEVEAIVLAERDHLELLEKAQETQLAYLDATRSVRGELEAMLAGRGDLGNFKQIFRDLKARVMVEQIFGPALQELEDYVTKNTALPDAVDVMATQTDRAGQAVGTFADVILNEAQRITNSATGAGAFDSAFADIGGGPVGDEIVPEIVVTGSRDVAEGIEQSKSVMGMTPERYFEQMTKQMVSPLIDELDDLFGTEFFGKLQGAFSGYLYGSATGGTVGGIFGLGKGLLEDFGTDLLGEKMSGFLSDKLGQGLGGAQKGTMVAGLGNMLGLNMSSSGAQIGGAIGSFIPIPGGDLIGSVAGGLLGGLFKSSKKDFGTVSLSNTGSLGSITSRGDEGSGIASGLGRSVQEALSNIAGALGAEVGAFDTMLGVYDGKYRVRTSASGWNGQGGLNFSGNSGRGLHDFGQDEAGAIAFAIADAIGDGAIRNISAAVQKALKSSSDIDKAIEEALAVSELEDLLGDASDAWRRELEEFEEIARERVELARRYGLDLVEVEELNARERAKLTEAMLEKQVGSLQDLIEQMTSGNLFEGSAVDRREALLGDIAAARVAAQAGEEGAADRLAELLRQLNEVSSEVYGSTGGFASDRDTILDTARDVIAAANQRLEGAKGSDPAIAQTNAALDENNDQNAVIIGRLDDLNRIMRDFAAMPGDFNGRGRVLSLARTN